MIIHIVAPGDTTLSIASTYGVSPARLSYDNHLSQQTHLVPGQAVLVLIPKTIHQVQKGDTLTSISAQYGISLKKLMRNNPYLTNTTYLIPGEFLIISYQDETNYPLKIDGYAYPFINQVLLKNTLPYLSTLSVFSYGFTPTGELIPVDDEPLLGLAAEAGTKSILVLTPFSETGVFNNELVSLVSHNPDIQENLIDNLVQTVTEKGYRGVDVDFEYILAKDRYAFPAFVRNLRERMNSIGVTVSVALAPKTSADQPGLLYEGVDYRLLGEAADSVLLMTYEWGYTYGPPMAVAPLPSVRRVLDYAITEIPPHKISMGIPNYGYDWPLPFIRGETKAKSIGNQEAVAIAAENNVSIQYSDVSEAPFFEYIKNGTQHMVWFEDVRSILAKINLALEYGFAGVDYWQLMRPFRQNWMLLNYMLHILSA